MNKPLLSHVSQVFCHREEKKYRRHNVFIDAKNYSEILCIWILSVSSRLLGTLSQRAVFHCDNRKRGRVVWALSKTALALLWGSNCVWRLGIRYMLCEKKILCPVSPNCLADVGQNWWQFFFLSPAAIVMMGTARTFFCYAFVIFNLYWLQCFLLEMPVRVKAMAFSISLALILVQDTTMKITLALIYSPHEFDDALIACTCLSFSLDGQRGYVDSFLRFALKSSFIVFNNVLRIIIRRKSQNQGPQP